MDEQSEDEPAPEEWVIARVCEEFGCLPSQAIEEIENDLGGFLFRVMLVRNYARAKDLYEEGLKEPDITKRPKGPMLDKVREISWELRKNQYYRKINK